MVPPGPPVILRPAEARDLPRLLELKLEVFGRGSLEAERRRWEWQFDRNPACPPGWTRALVAEDEEGLAGYFAHVPLAVDLDDTRGLAADGIDLCLHPRLRGRGLGRALVEPMWAPGFCEFPFAAGLNAASHHLFTACGGQRVGAPEEVCGHVYFVQDAHPPRPGGLPTEAVDSFEEDCDRLWEASRGPHRRLALRRDAAALNWRYRDFPFQPVQALRARDDRGRTRGLAVLQRDPVLDRCYLLELICAAEDVEARRGLLSAATEWADRSGRSMLYYATRDRGQSACLAAADFRPLPGEVPNFIGKLHTPERTTGLSVQDWWISLGDGDPLYVVGEETA